MTFRSDTRAVSTAVTHAMAIGVTALLVTGLLISSSQMVDGQRERVTEGGLEDVGSAVTSEIVRLDQFNTTTTNVSFTSEYPDQIGGNAYDLTLVERSTSPYQYTLTLESRGETVGVSVTTRIETTTQVCEGTVGGGTITVAYSQDSDCIELRDPR